MNTPTNRDMDCLTFGGPAIAPLEPKGCPFCGMRGRVRMLTRTGEATVYCASGELHTANTGYWATPDEAVAAWNRRPEPPKPDLCVIEAMLAYPSVNEFVRGKEREIARLVQRLREALDYVTDATERWPVGSLENEVARAIEGRCRAEVEGYPADGAASDTERSGTPTPPAAPVQS